MDLEAAEEEAPCAACQCPWKVGAAWVEGYEHTCGFNGPKGGKERETLKEWRRVAVEFDDEMDAIPEVGDFVFEDAAGEGEDAVDHLSELEEIRVVCC